jgi:hypothetical protein
MRLIIASKPSTKFGYLPLHLGIAPSFGDALEGGLHLALDLETPATGTCCGGGLNDITSEL